MIKLSKMTDYGVVVMTQIAQEPDRVVTGPDVALTTGLTVPTVAKLMRMLARGGLLLSHRGAHGGYSMARPASEIRISEIVAALEGPIALTSCVDGSDLSCVVEDSCPMRGGWNKINGAIRQALDDVRLSEMMPPMPYPHGTAKGAVRKARAAAAL
ncbi:SUF system Fe-S cluster assembly regulator [Oceanibacterium hippocampi]|uniref:HTH-type transcriptional regulator CymR n=1 Tax=Oceanibacterium hippocampi TaxID=745714 RepID=A0A1Y5T7D5_9PROT|nr:SUF system Fe-S cluster assembly regulator [Oceanibacterium hippocampi]SLN57506.1 HTH-type transcriptional regulator CymR [Oceanibacterium hippocampi]